MKSATTDPVLSHWHQPVTAFQTSAQDFYQAIQQSLTPHKLPGVNFSKVEWKEGGVLSARREYLRIQREKLCFDVCAAPFGEDFFFSWWLTERPAKWGWLRFFAILFGLWIVFTIIGAILGTVFGKAGSILGAIVSVPFTILAFLGAVWGLGNALHNGAFGPGAEDAVIDTPIIGWLYVKLFGPNTYYKIDTTLTYQAVVHGVVTDLVNERLTAKGLKPLTELEAKPVMSGFLAQAQYAGR